MTEPTKSFLESSVFDGIVAPAQTAELQFDYVHEERLGKGAIVVHDMLSGDECDELVKFIDTHDRAPQHEGEVTLIAASSSQSHRNNQRACISSPALGAALMARLAPVLSSLSLQQDTITCSPGNAHCFLNRGFGMRGDWMLRGLNPMFRLCKYHPGGHFGPHYDADFVQDPMRRRSLKTFMLYLNDDYEGGETSFLDSHELHFDQARDLYCAPAECVFASLKARRGDCLVFDHLLLHEGQQVTRGQKYLLRSDVMYEKAPADLDEAGQRQEQQQEQALAVYLRGVRLEEGGDIDGAIQLYRRAFKMCPEIEDAYS